MKYWGGFMRCSGTAASVGSPDDGKAPPWTPPSSPPPNSIHDWSGYVRGEHVTLHHPAGIQLRGVLDMRTDDASVVWIHLNNGEGRRMVHREDGYRLLRA